MGKTLFAIGEALIDFIPNEVGCSFNEVKAFSPKIGGAPANVLGAFSKLGGSTQLITQLGDDPFGIKIYDNLNQYHIGTKHILFTKKANTALAFVSLDTSGQRTFSFYRNPSSDMLYDGSNLNNQVFQDIFALHFCSVSLGLFPMKASHKTAINYARENNGIISFDVNLRFQLWDDLNLLKDTIEEFLDYADIVKVSDDELSFVCDTTDIFTASIKLLKKAKLVIITCGNKGTYAFTKLFKVYQPVKKIKAVDTTGAGDGFIGAVLYLLMEYGYTKDNLDDLSKDTLDIIIKKANDYATNSVLKKGAIESYPDSI